jgi:hypothetical protein
MHLTVNWIMKVLTVVAVSRVYTSYIRSTGNLLNLIRTSLTSAINYCSALIPFTGEKAGANRNGCYLMNTGNLKIAIPVMMIAIAIFFQG